MNKPLYLRGFWRDDNLHFDSIGHLKDNSLPVSFALSGFELKKVHLKQDKLILDGRRVGLEFKDNKPLRIPLNAGKPTNPTDEPIHIEIDASSVGDYGPALDTVFVEDLAKLAPSLPFYWKSYASKELIPATTTSNPSETPVTTQQNPSTPSQQPKRIGGSITPPKLLKAKEPDFNDVARSLKYSGISLIHFWLKPDGTVTNLSILRPLGLGLDERALAAVQQYTFSPAMENGKPVLVELNVEVNFQIY